MAEVRRFNAVYAFAGVAVEMERSCPLAHAERMIGHGRVRVRRGWRSPLGYYRGSSDRLCVLTHRALGPDQVVEVPRSCITTVHPPDARGVVTVECSDGTRLPLSPFSWSQVAAAAARVPARRVDPHAAQAIYDALTRTT